MICHYLIHKLRVNKRFAVLKFVVVFCVIFDVNADSSNMQF